ncbi:MAG: hypothetical protein ACT4OV_02730 [Microthrixaceae bacterium]
MAELERFFFLRFQKTGGTALAQRLRANLGASAVYPLPEDNGHAEAVLWVDLLLERFAAHRDELRVIAGHFPLCVTDLLGVPFSTFTVLRDPVERTLSLLRSREQRGAARYRGMALEAIYEDPELHDIIDNHMVKMLSLSAAEMTSTPLTQPLEFDDARFAVAAERLASVDVVGVQERYDEFCGALESRFGWDLGPPRFANRTEQRPVSTALRSRIAADNSYDVDLYQLAQRMVSTSVARATPRREPVHREAGKIVITGTGRAGTTLLVQILDELGLDTGLAEGKTTPYGPMTRAGLEARVDDPEAPRVVKDMTLGFRIREILSEGAVRIDHVILPDRRLDVAAASRIRAARYGRRPFGRGALTGTIKATEQIRVLETMRHEIVSALDDFGIPYTVLQFPRFASDATYALEALTPILPGVSLAEMEQALARCVRPELIHEAPLTWSERWRTRAITAWMVLYRYPVARLRGMINPADQEARLRASVAAARQREAELIEAERNAGRMPGATGPSAPDASVP